jgi:hypothetical protein
MSSVREKAIYLLILGSSALHGTPFTAQSECYNRGVADFGTLSCSVSLPMGPEMYPESAFVNNIVTLSDYAGMPFDFELRVEKSMGQAGVLSSFRSQVQYEVTLRTGGEARLGLISYSFLSSIANNCFDAQTWTVGDYTGSAIGRLGDGSSGRYLPFPLGTDFAVKLTSEAFAKGIDFGTIYGATVLQFRLFEADGITPVALLETPEPAFAGVVGLAVLGIVWRRRRIS